MKDQFKGPSAWDDYIAALEAASPAIEALAVTDYYVTDTYERVIQFKDAGRLPNVGLVFPNVEVRLDVATAKGSFVNLHLFVSPEDDDHIEQLERLLSRLHFTFQADRYDCTRSELIRLGKRRVQDLTKADVTKMMNDIIAGKTRAVRKTSKKRGKSVLRGGRGTASKCVGLTGSMLTYAISMGIIEHNVAHGIRKPKDQVRDRRLSEDEYRLLGTILRKADDDPELAPTVAITRLLALTGCRRGEIISLKWSEVDFENSCLRLTDSKEGASTRPIGLPVIELLEVRRKVVSTLPSCTSAVDLR